MQEQVQSLIKLALAEDGGDDPTSLAVSGFTTATAHIVAKVPVVVSGLWLLSEICRLSQKKLESLKIFYKDGVFVEAGSKLATISMNARALLGLERTMLNFLQRTCGVATHAYRVKQMLGDRNIQIKDTRKTIPAWRYLDKMAVRDGGLWNHRFALDDAILIKENHILAAKGLAHAIKNCRTHASPNLSFQVEVRSIEEAKEAIDLGVVHLLLDNFSPQELKAVVKDLRAYHPKLTLEASGNITKKNLSEYLNTCIDCISMGELTHSVVAADLSMLFSFE